MHYHVPPREIRGVMRIEMTYVKGKIDSFDFQPGRLLSGKYEVMLKLGEGWEGEVYLLKEKATGIERAAKFFFPHRNPGNKALNFYAKKLHKLRNCRALIHYVTHEKFRFKGTPLTFLVSDYIEGEILLDFLKHQPGKRLDYFQGLHLLHSLASAVEEIHGHRDYHGDLHRENVMVRRLGLGFDIKLLDFYPLGTSKKDGIKDDICDVIKIFYDSIGGRKRYAKHPQEIKSICCGLKRGLIHKKFRTITALRLHLETMVWDES
jgi:serine/threonine protein kinase